MTLPSYRRDDLITLVAHVGGQPNQPALYGENSPPCSAAAAQHLQLGLRHTRRVVVKQISPRRNI